MIVCDSPCPHRAYFPRCCAIRGPSGLPISHLLTPCTPTHLAPLPSSRPPLLHHDAADSPTERARVTGDNDWPAQLGGALPGPPAVQTMVPGQAPPMYAPAPPGHHPLMPGASVWMRPGVLAGPPAPPHGSAR